MTQKQVTIKLFYGRSNNQHYILIGETLFAIPNKVAIKIADKEELSIRECDGEKSVQELVLEDNKNKI